MISVGTLLAELPPYQNLWVLIKDKQRVKDIMQHIVKVHKKYPAYYDKIALYFDADTIEKICDNLYFFLKQNIKYKEETEEDQTTGIPTGILVRAVGDCKHYASFCGGILDAISRMTGKKIDWCYRFASYKFLETTPHHVFVVVNDAGREIWIDPVPGANETIPTWYIDKKVNSSSMALSENIAGVKVGAFPSLGLIQPVQTDALALGSYAGAFMPYLGLSKYKEGSLGTNWNNVAAAINAMIPQGPQPGHTVPADFVKWVFDNDLKYWNFYYPGGVQPGFSADSLLPANWPRLVITPDHRLTYDRLVPIPEDAAETQLLTAWAQDLINRFDTNPPHPMKTASMKGFSQGQYGGVDQINMFHEYRGDSFLKDLGKAIEDTVNFVKAGVLKIVGSVPRNAFLSLVGLNVFGWATKLDKKITEGHWEKMKNTWYSIGGNPDKLMHTIYAGKTKPEVLAGQKIGVVPAPAGAAAWLAAAAPIIAIMLKFLDTDGKAAEIASAVKDTINTSGLFPQLTVDIGSSLDFLDRNTGKPVQWEIDPIDNENLGGGNDQMPPSNGIQKFISENPLPVAGIVGLGTYFLTNKKGRKPNFVIPGIAAVATYFVITQMMNSSSTAPDKRQMLINWLQSGGDSVETKERVKQIFLQMPAAEIDVVYTYISQYVMPEIPLPENTALHSQMMAINSKYNLFS